MPRAAPLLYNSQNKNGAARRGTFMDPRFPAERRPMDYDCASTALAPARPLLDSAPPRASIFLFPTLSFRSRRRSTPFMPHLRYYLLVFLVHAIYLIVLGYATEPEVDFPLAAWTAPAPFEAPGGLGGASNRKDSDSGRREAVEVLSTALDSLDLTAALRSPDGASPMLRSSEQFSQRENRRAPLGGDGSRARRAAEDTTSSDVSAGDLHQEQQQHQRLELWMESRLQENNGPDEFAPRRRADDILIAALDKMVEDPQFEQSLETDGNLEYEAATTFLGSALDEDRAVTPNTQGGGPGSKQEEARAATGGTAAPVAASRTGPHLEFLRRRSQGRNLTGMVEESTAADMSREEWFVSLIEAAASTLKLLADQVDHFANGGAPPTAVAKRPPQRDCIRCPLRTLLVAYKFPHLTVDGSGQDELQSVLSSLIGDSNRQKTGPEAETPAKDELWLGGLVATGSSNGTGNFGGSPTQTGIPGISATKSGVIEIQSPLEKLLQLLQLLGYPPVPPAATTRTSRVVRSNVVELLETVSLLTAPGVSLLSDAASSMLEATARSLRVLQRNLVVTGLRQQLQLQRQPSRSTTPAAALTASATYDFEMKPTRSRVLQDLKVDTALDAFSNRNSSLQERLADLILSNIQNFETANHRFLVSSDVVPGQHSTEEKHLSVRGAEFATTTTSDVPMKLSRSLLQLSLDDHGPLDTTRGNRPSTDDSTTMPVSSTGPRESDERSGTVSPQSSEAPHHVHSSAPDMNPSGESLQSTESSGLLDPVSSAAVGGAGTDEEGDRFQFVYLNQLHMEFVTVPEGYEVEAFVEQLKSDSNVAEVFRDHIVDLGTIDPVTGMASMGKKNDSTSPGQAARRLEPTASGADAGEFKFSGATLQEVNWSFLEPSAPLHTTDHYLQKQWALMDEHQHFGAANVFPAWRAWAAHVASSGQRRPMVIALLDSGVDVTHYDLNGRHWRNEGEICDNYIDDDGNGYIDDCYGWDFIQDDRMPQDETGHGTAAAGIMVAVPNNGLGIAPVCLTCVIMNLRVLDRDNRGPISGFVRAIDYALQKGARISNNSYGGRGEMYQILYEAVARARNAGMVFVAAAGNQAVNNDLPEMGLLPSSYPMDNIISVAAVTSTGHLAAYSNFGKQTVHLGAPGHRIYSTIPGAGYVEMQGTSFAAPHVTALVAMIWDAFPNYTYHQVIQRVLAGSRPIPTLREITVTGGTLDALKSLAMSDEEFFMLRTKIEAPGQGGPNIRTVVPVVPTSNCGLLKTLLRLDGC